MAERDDRARIRILEAYEHAKRNNPALTQGEFMRTGAPGSRVKGLVGKFKSDDSAARYFRKIKTGERTGGAMYREGRQKGTLGSFQFRIKIAADKWISQNIAVAGAESTFDIAAVEYELKRNRRERVLELINAYRMRYEMETVPIDLDALEVYPVNRVRKPYRIWTGID